MQIEQSSFSYLPLKSGFLLYCPVYSMLLLIHQNANQALLRGVLPGESHGHRSLVGCSPWGRLESDTTEQLDFHSSLSCIGEANGNPLQCSCLENPRDGGAWWATVDGVAQSRTRLKRLSSSSSKKKLHSFRCLPLGCINQGQLIKLKFGQSKLQMAQYHCGLNSEMCYVCANQNQGNVQ